MPGHPPHHGVATVVSGSNSANGSNTTTDGPDFIRDTTSANVVFCCHSTSIDGSTSFWSTLITEYYVTSSGL